MTDDYWQLPDAVLAAVRAAGGADSDQRAEAFAEDRGHREHRSDGSGLGLITIRLTDLGCVGAYTPAVDRRS